MAFYILKDKKLKKVSRTKWLEWEYTKPERRIAVTWINGATILTRFTHENYEVDRTDKLFETEIIDGPNDGRLFKYKTYEEAMEWHFKVVAIVMGADPDKVNVLNFGA